MARLFRKHEDIRDPHSENSNKPETYQHPPHSPWMHVRPAEFVDLRITGAA